MVEELAPERVRDRGRAHAAGDPEPERRHRAVEREARVPEAGDDRREQHGRSRLRGPADPSARELRGEREQPDRPGRGEERARRREQAGARVVPRQREPADGERRRRRSRARPRCSRAGRTRSRARARSRRAAPRSRARPRRRRARAATAPGRTAAPRRPSRRSARTSPPGARGTRARGAPAPLRPRRSSRPRRRRERFAESERSSSASAAADGRRLGPSASAEATASRSRGGRSGRSSASGGAPDWIRCDVSRTPPSRNGWTPASASHSITPTAHTSALSVAGRPSSRSGEMYAERARDVADRGQRVELGHLREPEVEQPDVDRRRRLGEQHVRRLHVAVDDPAPVRVRERLEHLRRDLDGGAVVDLAGGERLAHRLPGHVLVGDVDVGRVARERVDPLAARVAERRRRPAPRARRARPPCPRARRSSAPRRGRSPRRSASQTWPIPPDPSGRSGRYRPRIGARSGAARAHPAQYFAPRRSPFPDERG